MFSLSSFLIGRIFIIVGGLFPFCVGLNHYIKAISLYFTGPIFLNSPCLIYRHVGYTNLMVTGVVLISLSFFALPEKKKWSWCLLFIIHFWAGLNDSAALLIPWIFEGKYRVFPTPIIPTILVTIGLILVYKDIFRRDSKK